MFANRDRGPQDVPKNLKMVHDAVISGAGSTSLSLIAYNDIFPYRVQEKSKGYLRRLQETADQANYTVYKEAKDAGEKIIIGDSGQQRAVMGFFDRHWLKLAGPDAIQAAQEAGVSDADIKAMIEDGGKAFFSEAELARMSDKEKNSHNKSQHKSRRLVEWALANGWVSPFGGNRAEREHLAVTPDQFLDMVQVMEEANGLYEGSTPIFGSVKKGKTRT